MGYFYFVLNPSIFPHILALQENDEPSVEPEPIIQAPLPMSTSTPPMKIPPTGPGQAPNGGNILEVSINI